MIFDFYVPTKLISGPGSLKKLHKEQLPGKKALVVISQGKSMKKNGYLDLLFQELDQADVSYVLFDGVQANPTLEAVRQGSKLQKEEDCDFVIGLGGGSTIDNAKAIAIMGTNSGDYWDYMQAGSGKRKPLEKRPLPLVAITTTAGTGTETDPWMVITHEELNEKIGYGNDWTYPVLSIVDPELMLTVPTHLTAYQGFDALFHVVEGYINRNHDPIADQFSLQAIELIGKSLPVVVKDGSNLEARTDVALANTLAGYSQSMSGCISHHTVEHTLSGFHPNLPHGAGLIMTSKAYFSQYLKWPEVIGQRYIDMAKALGKKDASKAEDFIEALVDLQKACGVDNLRMSDFGIKEEEFPKMLEMLYYLAPTGFSQDPAELRDEDFLTIYKESYQ